MNRRGGSREAFVPDRERSLLDDRETLTRSATPVNRRKPEVSSETLTRSATGRIGRGGSREAFVRNARVFRYSSRIRVQVRFSRRFALLLPRGVGEPSRVSSVQWHPSTPREACGQTLFPMSTLALSTPSLRILDAAAAEEPLAEVTLATRFGETLPIRQLLQRWQFDQRVHALLARVGPRRALAVTAVPAEVAESDTYAALVGSPVGFVAQFAALCAWRDPWGRQALLAYPETSHGLWNALVWAGTGRRPGVADPALLGLRRSGERVA